MKKIFTQILRSVCSLNRLNYPRFIIQTKLPPVPEDFGSFRDVHDVIYLNYPSGDDHVTKALFWFGAFDPWVVRTMKLLSGEGDVVCDVGANLGDTALPLSRHVGLSGKVFCFEPLPANVARLKANIDANGFPNIILAPFALTESECTLQMETFEGQPGMAQITEAPKTRGLIEISGVPFDSWANSNGVGEVAVCKIDVQGHELAVLKGMEKSIVAGKIRSFIFEHEGTPSEDDPVFSFLLERGYRIFRIENRLFTNVFSLLGAEPKARRTRDFVAVLAGDPREELLKLA